MRPRQELLTSLMEVVGVLIEKYEDEHAPGLVVDSGASAV
jgi:hypothetical protein